LISTAATGIKLKKEIDCLSDKEFNENLDFINNSTQYLSKTIDDFRNFFATDKENKIFTIKEAFENTFKLISSQFKNKDIEIINNINESKLFYIKSELIQVLINILNNSIDELEKLEDQKRLIILNSYEIDKELIISIKDNGGGIKPEIIEHVFEPYFTTKHKSQGIGIGMYMSEEIIVKHMNGKINIKNCTFEYDDIKYKGAEVILELKLV
jgi:C4-dicarboxylate-specific signal transduction histidine kinase